MLKLQSLIEAYLDDKNQFWDYNTSDVHGSDIFDTTKTGMSFYDDFIKDPEYMKNSKNLISEIKLLSPREYFEGCADIFNSTSQKQISQTATDVETIEHLKQVILDYKKKFPITFLNYAEKQQEGRHRMYVAGELFGWDKKYPVLVINWADPEKEIKRQKAKEQEELNYKLRLAVKETLRYQFKDLEDFKDQLQWELDRAFNDYDRDLPEVSFTLDEYSDDEYIVKAKGAEYIFDKSDMKIKDIDAELEDLIDEEDLDDWLSEYIK